MGRAIPVRSSASLQAGTRCCRPMSECGSGASPPSSLPSRPAGIPGAVFMFGDLDIDQATTSSLQGSTAGERRGFAPPTLNSATSVAGLAIGPSAPKSRAGRSGEGLPARPHAEAAPPAPADPEQQPLLAHGLARRLVGDANAGRFAQRVGNASVSVSEPGFLAYPRYGRPLVARLPEGARLVAAIGGARHPDGLQERGERIFPPRRLRCLVLPPAAERAAAEAAVRLEISASISRRAHRRSSASSPAGSFLLRPGGWTTGASSPPPRRRFTRSRVCAPLRTPCSRARALQSPSPRR